MTPYAGIIRIRLRVEVDDLSSQLASQAPLYALQLIRNYVI